MDSRITGPLIAVVVGVVRTFKSKEGTEITLKLSSAKITITPKMAMRMIKKLTLFIKTPYELSIVSSQNMEEMSINGQDHSLRIKIDFILFIILLESSYICPE